MHIMMPACKHVKFSTWWVHWIINRKQASVEVLKSISHCSNLDLYSSFVPMYFPVIHVYFYSHLYESPPWHMSFFLLFTMEFCFSVAIYLTFSSILSFLKKCTLVIPRTRGTDQWHTCIHLVGTHLLKVLLLGHPIILSFQYQPELCQETLTVLKRHNVMWDTYKLVSWTSTSVLCLDIFSFSDAHLSVDQGVLQRRHGSRNG